MSFSKSTASATPRSTDFRSGIANVPGLLQERVVGDRWVLPNDQHLHAITREFFQDKGDHGREILRLITQGSQPQVELLNSFVGGDKKAIVKVAVLKEFLDGVQPEVAEQYRAAFDRYQSMLQLQLICKAGTDFLEFLDQSHPKDLKDYTVQTMDLLISKYDWSVAAPNTARKHFGISTLHDALDIPAEPASRLLRALSKEDYFDVTCIEFYVEAMKTQNILADSFATHKCLYDPNYHHEDVSFLLALYLQTIRKQDQEHVGRLFLPRSVPRSWANPATPVQEENKSGDLTLAQQRPGLSAMRSSNLSAVLEGERVAGASLQRPPTPPKTQRAQFTSMVWGSTSRSFKSERHQPASSTEGNTRNGRPRKRAATNPSGDDNDNDSKRVKIAE